MRPRRGTVILVALAAAVFSTGCATQLAAIAPVGGRDITALRIAAIDVLQDLDIDMMQVPVCVDAAEPVGGYQCEGTTVDAKSITVTSDGTTPLTFTLEVDGTEVFAGSVRDVIDKAAGEAG